VGLVHQYLAEFLGEGRRFTNESAVVAGEFGGRKAEMFRQRQTATIRDFARLTSRLHQ
jgi:hypothetical protein